MAEAAAWRAELSDRLTAVEEDVDGLFERLDLRVADFKKERLHGRDAATTTGASARGTVEAWLGDFSDFCASLGAAAAADMLDIEKSALAGASDDQAAPLASIHHFHVRDEGAFQALLGLQRARAHAGDARGSVESACGFIRSAGLILGTQPRPPRVGVVLNHKRLGAVNALRAAVDAWDDCRAEVRAAIPRLVAAEENEIWWEQGGELPHGDDGADDGEGDDDADDGEDDGEGDDDADDGEDGGDADADDENAVWWQVHDGEGSAPEQGEEAGGSSSREEEHAGMSDGGSAKSQA